MSEQVGDEPELLDLTVVNELRAAWTHDTPRFPATDEGFQAEFLTKVYDFAREWLHVRSGPVAGAQPCVFVQSRSIIEQSEALNASELAYFSSTPDEDVAGRVFLANADFSVVTEIQVDACTQVKQVATTLQALGLAEHMHAVFRPDLGELIVCERGLRNGNRRVPVSLAEHKRLSALDLEREIWRFHRLFTQTPSGVLTCWRGAAADRVTGEKLERQISGMLAFFVALIVGSDNVSAEHDTSHGRIDVYITRHGMDAAAGACVLELKVLRSREFSSTEAKGWTTVSDNEMIKHASEGIAQALEYLDDQRAQIAYLLCFDARLVDQDQPEVLTLAAGHGVNVRRYYMYPSPAAARQARMAAIAQGRQLSGEPA